MTSSAVLVAVRCRPLNESEKGKGGSIVSMRGKTTSLSDPGGKGKPQSFSFDYSFWSGKSTDATFVSQEAVFEQLGTKLLDNAFEGYNGCLFAYGQTGSGKTYTMIGYGSDRGVIPRLCEELFRQAEKKKEDSACWEMHVEVSYFEIYNEKCRCLLAPPAKEAEYRVREHPATGPYVEDLTKTIVHTPEDIDKLMCAGNKTRTVAATAMNATSSRSHAIFTLKVTQVTTHPDQQGAQSEMVSKINLVDLAGSERASRTGAAGATLKEGSNINQSLTTLGKVINGLADGLGPDNKPKKHIPYRDSALTWLLKENLGGNSKTIMLAAISPAAINYEETLSTLRYADRAKALRTVAIVNEDPTSKTIRELTEEINRLKTMLEKSADVSSASLSTESLAQQLAETERLRAQEQTTWREKEEQAREIQALRDELAAQQGMGTRPSREVPSLFNLSEDPYMSGSLFYTLDSGSTAIGAAMADLRRNILLQGEQILDVHATITVEQPADKASPHLVTLTPEAGAAVCVNGAPITAPVTLQHNDRVILGRSHVFRHSDPRVATGAGAVSDYHKALEEKFQEEKHALLRQASDGKIVRLGGVEGEFVVVKADVQEQQTSMLRDMEEKVRTMESEAKKRESRESSLGSTRLIPAESTDRGSVHTPLAGVAQHSANKFSRLPNRQIFFQKAVLLGHQEVGKTSLRKCFQGDPIFSFMAKLPEVRTTTGVDTQDTCISVQGNTVDLRIADFAGQESYHSHAFFLTNRSIFVLVWKISAVEQDFRSRGISDHEQERLCHWIDEVYAKFPRAKLLIVATHLDEMRDQSAQTVGIILDKVKSLLLAHAARVARLDDNGEPLILNIVEHVAVSCKTRKFLGIGSFEGRGMLRISDLITFIAEVAHQQCSSDDYFPSAAIPGRHIRFITEVKNLKRGGSSAHILISLAEYVQLAIRCGIASDEELLQVSQLMHSWGTVHLFNQHRLNTAANAFVFLHPAWLCKMSGTLFSFAHVSRTPLHLRSLIQGLDYLIGQAEAADMSLLSLGILRFPLMRVLFRSCLNNLHNRVPEEADYIMCAQLLMALELIHPHDTPSMDVALCREEGLSLGAAPGFVRRYLVPSLSPFSMPTKLRLLAPLLFHAGLHVQFKFNMIPQELWFRLLHRLWSSVRFLTIPCPSPSDEVSDAFCLPEADEVHNAWNDGMWLQVERGRLLLVRDSNRIRLFSAELKDSGASMELFTKVDECIQELLEDYVGVERVIVVECPVPHCSGWLHMQDIKTMGEVRCGLCSSLMPVASIPLCGIGELGVRNFEEARGAELERVLETCLDPRTADGITQLLQLDIENTEPGGSLSVGVLKALDNTVKDMMLRESWEIKAQQR